MSTWSFTLDHGGDITHLVDLASIDRTLRLHSELQPNVNKLSFRVRYDSTLFGALLSYDPIEIQVDKDSTPYFTGFLSPNYRAQIRDGQRFITLLAEDPTLQTLGTIISEPWSAAGFAVCTPLATSTSLVHAIATAAGVTLAAGAPTISSVVPYVVVLPEEKNTWGNLLAAILFEYGYGYSFDPDGTLALYPLVNTGTITSTGTLTTAAGTANIRGEIEIEKTPERYDDIRVSYDLVELKTGITVFQDADEITLAAAGDAGGADYYPLTSKIGEVYSAWKSPDGYTIWVVTSATLSATLESGITLDRALSNYYKKASFAYKNTAAAAKKITGLKITGNAYVVASRNVVRSNTTAGKLLLEHAARYLFSDAAAQALAEKLGQYYRYADIKYTVRSSDVFALGQYVTVSDAIYAGISTQCRVVGITQHEAATLVYEYALEGVADFVAISTITEGGHDGTPSSGAYDESDYYLNTAPSANITDLVISSAPNPSGAVDVTFEFNYTQGAVSADGFLIFTKQSILTPGTIDINTDRAHFVPVGADGAYSVVLTLPTRQAGAGTIPIHYRFGVVSFGSRRSGTVVHAGGPVEDASWIDVTFAADITDMPIRSYNGQGVNRRAIQIDDEALDWIDCPDTSPASPELRRARIGRLGVGSQVLLDGEFNALVDGTYGPETALLGDVYNPYYIQLVNKELLLLYIDSSLDLYQIKFANNSWGTPFLIDSGSCYQPSGIQQSDGTIRIAYQKTGAGLVEKIWNGTSYGSDIVITSDTITSPQYIEYDGDLRMVYGRAGLLYERIYSGSAWGAESAYIDTGSYPTYCVFNGELRLAYTNSGSTCSERIYSGSSWGAATIIASDSSIVEKKYSISIQNILSIAYYSSTTKLAIRYYSGTTWGSPVVIRDAVTTYFAYLADTSGLEHIAYRIGSPGSYQLVERTLQRYAQLGAGIVESGSNANGSYIKFSDGTMQCWATTANLTSAATATITFPAAFTSAPNVISNPTFNSASSGPLSFRHFAYNATTTAFSVWGAGIAIQYIAIGRWK